MIEECPVNLECKVIDTLRYGSYEVWIAEVVETYLDGGIVPAEPKRWPSIDEVNLLVYTPAGTYWDMGKQIGRSYDSGKAVKNRGN